MAPMKTEDDLRLLHNMVKLSSSKASTAEVAKSMGLKQSATNWRIQTLFKRLDKEFGSADGNVPPAVTTKPNTENKRKRSSKGTDESMPKSKKQQVDEKQTVKVEAAVDGDDTADEDGFAEENDA